MKHETKDDPDETLLEGQETEIEVNASIQSVLDPISQQSQALIPNEEAETSGRANDVFIEHSKFR